MAYNQKAWSFHGPGGALSGCTRTDVVNAMGLPTTGLMTSLPVVMTVETDPTTAILTGQLAGTGSLPNTLCGDWPVAGQLKICRQHYPLGRQGIDSQQIALDQMGQILNRCDILDYELVGDPFRTVTQEAPTPLSLREALRSEKSKALTQMWVEWLRRYSPKVFEGDPANNLGQGYAEYYGLETLVNTGYQDAYTGIACEAADPLVLSFDENIETDPTGLVRLMVDGYQYLKHRARQTGFANVQWAFVMTPVAFRKIAEIWPCVYFTYTCGTVGENNRGTLDTVNARRMVDEMYSGEHIDIMGDRVPVILDDSLPNEYAAQVETSDIYLIPISSPTMTSTNGALTYWEYFNFNNPYGALRGELAELTGANFQVAGQGRFLVWRKANVNNCIQFSMLAKMRLMLRTPFLSMRITGVEAGFTIADVSPFPGDPYYKNGGIYYMDTPTFYDIIE